MRPDDGIDAVLRRHRELWAAMLRRYVAIAAIAGLVAGVLIGRFW